MRIGDVLGLSVALGEFGMSLGGVGDAAGVRRFPYEKEHPLRPRSPGCVGKHVVHVIVERWVVDVHVDAEVGVIENLICCRSTLENSHSVGGICTPDVI